MTVTRERKPSRQTLSLLRALLDAAPGWRHGYDLAKETGLTSGTLYPILMRLADRGLLESEWQPPDQPGRPPRRLHRLTPAGVSYADEALGAEVGGRDAAPLERRA